MKNWNESEATMKAYATLDAGYTMLSNIKKTLETEGMRSLSDDLVKRAIVILKDIILAKQVIEADAAYEVKFLAELLMIMKPVSSFSKHTNINLN